MKRKNNSLLLSMALLLVFTLVWTPAPVLAVENDTGSDGDFSWIELADGTAAVTGYTGPGGVVTIPGTLSGRAVSAIADDAFNGKTSLTGITIPDGVTTIGKRAFLSCEYLSSVTLPASLTSIEGAAFANCTGLAGINIPDSVTAIGYETFYGCSALISITIPDGVTLIYHGTFAGCSALESITIPDSVTLIGQSAFASCSSLNSISIPDSVTSILERAFARCSGLTDITIPSRVTTIEDAVFEDCSLLAKATFLTKTTSFGMGMFSETAISSDGIYGYNGSTAQAYATTNNIPFHLLQQQQQKAGSACTVTFDSQGGSAVPRQTAERYTAIDPPQNPTRAGYVFGGWYMDAACTQVWDLVAGRRDMTVYAKWNPGLTLYTGGKGTLGGNWDWDSAYLSLTQNRDGTVTVKGLKSGTTTVTYTLEGSVTEYQVTILDASLPLTGQDGGPVYILLSLGLVLLALAIGAKRKRDRRKNAF